MVGKGEAGIAIIAIALLILCWILGFNVGAGEDFGTGGNRGEYQVLFVHKSYFGTDVLMLKDTENPNNVIRVAVGESKNGKKFYAQQGDKVCLTKMNSIMTCGSFTSFFLTH